MAQSALEIMNREGQPHLPKGLAPDGKSAIMIKDIADADGRVYRVEFQSTLDAKKCVAVVRHNPWSKPGEGPAAGTMYTQSHRSSCSSASRGTSHPGRWRLSSFRRKTELTSGLESSAMPNMWP